LGTFGVGQFKGWVEGEDKKPLSLVRSTDFFRAKQARLNEVAHFLKVSADIKKDGVNEVGDVFNDDVRGLNLCDEPASVRPQIAGIVDPLLFSGDRVRLAWYTPNEAMYSATPWSAIEGAQIRENRRLIQGSFFHAESQDFTARGFPLHVQSASTRRDCQFKSHVKSSDA